MSFLLATTSFTMISLSLSALAAPCDETRSAARAEAVVRASSGDDNLTQVYSMTSDHAVEIRVDNGKLTVKVDGKEVPSDRIRQEGERIQILNDKGDEITSLNIIQNGGSVRNFPGEHAELFKGLVPTERMFHGQGMFQLDNSDPPRVMLGVQMGEPGVALEKHLKLEPGTTTMILAVGEDLAADKAGLEPFDIIISVEGQEPADHDTIRSLIAERDAGDTLRLTVIQAGEKKEIKVSLEEFDAEQLGSIEWQGERPQDFTFQFGDEGGQWQDIFVDPEHRVFQRLRVQPEEFEFKFDQDAVRELRERLRQVEPGGDDSPLNDRIDELNERMGELEELLRQLIEREQAR